MHITVSKFHEWRAVSNNSFGGIGNTNRRFFSLQIKKKYIGIFDNFKKNKNHHSEKQ